VRSVRATATEPVARGAPDRERRERAAV